MTKRPNDQNGLSKKELIEIIEKIDADQNQNEKPSTNSEDNSFYLSSKHSETR